MEPETRKENGGCDLLDMPTLRIEYEGKDRTRIVFENGDSEDLILTPIGSDLYRAEESSFLGEFRYQDLIRAIAQDDGSLLFNGIVTPSDLATQSWVLPKGIIASSQLREILDRVMATGGNWEQAFGGVLMIHVPRDHMESIAAQIKSLSESTGDRLMPHPTPDP